MLSIAKSFIYFSELSLPIERTKNTNLSDIIPVWGDIHQSVRYYSSANSNSAIAGESNKPSSLIIALNPFITGREIIVSASRRFS